MSLVMFVLVSLEIGSSVEASKGEDRNPEKNKKFHECLKAISDIKKRKKNLKQLFIKKNFSTKIGGTSLKLLKELLDLMTKLQLIPNLMQTTCILTLIVFRR